MSDALDFDQDMIDNDLLVAGDDEDSLYEALDVLLDDEQLISLQSVPTVAEESDSAVAPAKSRSNSISTTSSKKRSSDSRGAGKKRKLNPDATTIAANTEAALKELEVDLGSEEAKKMRRQIRNRLSAQFHRDRKNMYIKELEDKVSDRDHQIQVLESTVRALQAELDKLRQNTDVENITSSSSIVSGTMFTDSEYSSNPSDVDSPIFEPTSIVRESLGELPQYLTTQGNFSESQEYIQRNQLPTAYPRFLSTSTPLIKSLSMISVLCILCFCGQLSVNPQSNSAVPFVDHDATVTDINNVGSLLTTNLPGHRRLSQFENNSELFLSQSLQQLSANDSLVSTSAVPTFGLNSSGIFDKHYLRRSPDYSVNDSKSAGLSVDSKLPFPPTVFASQALFSQDSLKGWASHGRGYQSFSHIGVSQGFALFDPSMRFSEQTQHAVSAVHIPDASVHSANSWQGLGQQHQRLALPLPEKLHSRSAALEIVESEDTVNTQLDFTAANFTTSANSLPVAPEKHLMTLQNAPSQWPFVHPSAHSEQQAASVDSEVNQQLLAQLLSHSNILSVTLPASAIRMGTSLQDSQIGTMESIVKMFNLSSMDERAPKSLNGSSIAAASVEISCLVLGAKLIFYVVLCCLFLQLCRSSEHELVANSSR